MSLIVILSSEVALFPNFAIVPFSFTLPCFIRVSAFLLEVWPELAIIFCRRSISR